jgi:hypothetical protein
MMGPASEPLNVSLNCVVIGKTYVEYEIVDRMASQRTRV